MSHDSFAHQNADHRFLSSPGQSNPNKDSIIYIVKRSQRDTISFPQFRNRQKRPAGEQSANWTIQRHVEPARAQRRICATIRLSSPRRAVIRFDTQRRGNFECAPGEISPFHRPATTTFRFLLLPPSISIFAFRSLCSFI